MPFVFPAALPGAPAPRLSKFWIANSSARTRSSFTKKSRSYRWSGALWRAQLEFPTMPRWLAGRWAAILTAVDGPVGTFYLGDFDSRLPKGIAARLNLTNAAAPVVDGAGQSGEDLATRNWPVSLVGLLAEADHLQVGIDLYHTIKRADSDGAGKAVLTLRPRLRRSYADGTPIILYTPRGLFVLTEPDAGGWTADAIQQYGIAVNCEEALEG